MPRISVIVPVYKAEKYLNICVDSILQQTYRDLEVILVEDGSPDKCPELCDTYAQQDARVKVIHQENAGVAAARNRGLDAAEGDYITFVDSDDYLDPVMYEKMMEAAESSGSDLVLCDCVKEFGERTEVYTHNIRAGFYNKEQLKAEYYPHLLIMEDMEYPATISNCLCLFQKRIVEKEHLRYRIGIRFSEDWLFGAEVMINAESFYYMKGQNYYHYRMNEQSVTHTFAPDKWKDYCRLHECIREKFGGITEYDFRKQIDKVLLFFVYNAVGDLLKTKHLGRSEKSRAVREILSADAVREMFGRLHIWTLPVSAKLKLQTWCYKYNTGIDALVRYYERACR